MNIDIARKKTRLQWSLTLLVSSCNTQRTKFSDIATIRLFAHIISLIVVYKIQMHIPTNFPVCYVFLSVHDIRWILFANLSFSLFVAFEMSYLFIHSCVKLTNTSTYSRFEAYCSLHSSQSHTLVDSRRNRAKNALCNKITFSYRGHRSA